jgi:hypothetical protein
MISISFLERESAGIGPAKVEAAAKIIRSVRDRGLKRTGMMLLTESQEGSKDTDELHCSCCDGEVSWASFSQKVE